MAVREGHVGGVMGDYSRPGWHAGLCQSAPAQGHFCASDGALTVTSFPIAARSITFGAEHHFVATPEEAAAAAVKAGCDICCGGDYNALLKAVQKGLITEPEIDNALAYALKTRFRLGLFDPPALVPWSKIGIDQNDTPEHEALALKVAEESIVLLKNDGLLPLNRAKIKRIAVIGENADSVPVLVGNYNGTPARPVTILAGIKTVAGTNIAVTYAPGCPLALRKDGSNKPDAPNAGPAPSPPQNRRTWSFTSAASARSLKARK